MWLGQANNPSMYRKWEFFLGQNQADSVSKFQPGPTENSSEPGQPEGPEDFKHDWSRWPVSNVRSGPSAPPTERQTLPTNKEHPY